MQDECGIICIVFTSLNILQLLVLYGRDIRLFTRDATCSPVMPGRVLTRANSPGFFEAPWWAPTMYKKTMHERFCTIAGDASQPVSLQWFNEGQDQRLLVSRGPKVILKKGGLVKAEIYGDSIRSWTKKGYSEEPHSSLW